MTVAHGLLHYFFNGYHNIAKQDLPGVRIEILISLLFQTGKIPRRLITQKRKRQHIGRPVDLTVFFVDPVDLFIVHKRQIHLCLIRKILMIQSRIDHRLGKLSGIKIKIHCRFLFVFDRHDSKSSFTNSSRIFKN